MFKRNPYDVIKSRYYTEKTQLLSVLHTLESNRSIRKCQTPKVVFLVHPQATKLEIARAIEEIYAENNVRVIAVNTITIKGKKRRVRGRSGFTPSYKKAIVTLSPGDEIEEQK